MNKLKKGLAGALFVLGTLGLSGIASASTYTINGGTNVGQLDQLYASTTLATSGDAAELEWIQDALGSTSYSMTKFDVSETDWTLADGTTSVYATDLGLNAGDYFFIKLGNDTGLPGTDRHFLFQNMDMLAWAVIDLKTSFDNYFGADVTLKNIGKVSHVGNVGDTPVVPLPAATWLFGSALLGFVGFSVRRRV